MMILMDRVIYLIKILGEINKRKLLICLEKVVMKEECLIRMMLELQYLKIKVLLFLMVSLVAMILKMMILLIKEEIKQN